jgi:hypothetical protein
MLTTLSSLTSMSLINAGLGPTERLPLFKDVESIRMNDLMRYDQGREHGPAEGREEKDSTTGRSICQATAWSVRPERPYHKGPVSTLT